MAKTRFYGVAGTNGYGVFDDYDKVLEKKPYIKHFKIKGFRYYDEAESYAINTYKQLVYSESNAIRTCEVRRRNRFYHGSLSRNQNRERSFFDNYSKDKSINSDSNYKNNADDHSNFRPLIQPFSIGI